MKRTHFVDLESVAVHYRNRLNKVRPFIEVVQIDGRELCRRLRIDKFAKVHRAFAAEIGTEGKRLIPEADWAADSIAQVQVVGFELSDFLKLAFKVVGDDGEVYCIVGLRKIENSARHLNQKMKKKFQR